MRRFGRWAIILLLTIATPVAVAEDRAVVPLPASGESEPPISDSEPTATSPGVRITRPVATVSPPFRTTGRRPAVRPRLAPPFLPPVRIHVLCCVWRE